MDKNTAANFSVQCTFNDVHVPLSPELLNRMAGSLEDIEAMMPIFAELAKHSSFEIRQNIAQKDNLDRETVVRLAEDPCVDVVLALLRSDAAKEYLDIDMLRTLIQRDPVLANELAGSWNINSFSEVDTGVLCEALAAVPDEGVRFALAGNSNAVKKVLRVLSKDQNASVAQRARKTLDDM